MIYGLPFWQDCVGIVQRAFPILSAYPVERIEFLAPIQLDANNGVVGDRWGVIMDEAWSRFDRNPPARLRVQVQDGPGDEAASEFVQLNGCFYR
jgi:hypothetical protein